MSIQGVETGAGSEEDLGGGYSGSHSPRAQLGHSLFEYVDKQHQKSPLFYNFLYTPDLDNPVSGLYRLTIYLLLQNKNFP